MISLIVIFIVHTTVGIEEYVTAPKTECKEVYSGNVWYVMMLMFASMMSLIEIILMIGIVY